MKQTCPKLKPSSIVRTIAGNACRTNVDHPDCSILRRKKVHSTHSHGGYPDTIAAWIIGLAGYRDHENVNVVFKAAASIRPNGVIVMQIILVSILKLIE